MARLNISIPDALYARLDRLRDRVNASKVCASALEKELDMVEGAATSTADPGLVNRLVERLQAQQGEVDQWYQRGRQDGETWLLESATLDELKNIEEWAWLDELPSEPIGVSRAMRHGRSRMLPESFAGRDRVGEEPLRDDMQLKAAYLRGWYHVVDDAWKAAKPRVESPTPSREVAHPEPPEPPVRY